jgi:hypothetical protein
MVDVNVQPFEIETTSRHGDVIRADVYLPKGASGPGPRATRRVALPEGAEALARPAERYRTDAPLNTPNPTTCRPQGLHRLPAVERGKTREDRQ